jgi:hypothetical protein
LRFKEKAKILQIKLMVVFNRPQNVFEPGVVHWVRLDRDVCKTLAEDEERQKGEDKGSHG